MSEIYYIDVDINATKEEMADEIKDTIHCYTNMYPNIKTSNIRLDYCDAFKDGRSAQKYLNKTSRYSIVGVKYYDDTNVYKDMCSVKSHKLDALEAKLISINRERADYKESHTIEKVYPNKKFIECPNCGSKISIKYFSTCYHLKSCPVCFEITKKYIDIITSMLPKKVLKTLDKYSEIDKKISDEQDAERKRLVGCKNPELKWLIKVEI